MTREREVAIVHYNTPELTEATILSLRKHGGKDYHVTILDNSSERPFYKSMPGVDVIDNTKGQIIDFDAMLAQYPNKSQLIGCAPGCHFGSCKHIWSVEKLWDIIPQGFVLLDSDILLTQDIDFLWQDDMCAVGHVQTADKQGNPMGVERLVPMVCYINVPLCKKLGLRYFDPERTWGLCSSDTRDRRNWYDTGAVLLEDIRNNPEAHGKRIDIRPLMKHLGHGSWRHNGSKGQMEWLQTYRDLWSMEEERKPNGKIALCAIGRMENRYAREWVEHHLGIGFDKIFIYDNNQGDEERFTDVLSDYICQRSVQVIGWRDRRGAAQREAYTNLYMTEGGNYDWIAFFDFDEFLELPQGGNVHTLMKDCKGDCLLVNWMMMTDNNLVTYDDRPLRERFTEAVPNTKRDINRNLINSHVKSIVRGGLEIFAFIDTPHVASSPGMRCVNTDNERLDIWPFQRIHHDKAFLRHYSTKTIEEWMTVKLVRQFPEKDDFNKAWKKMHLDYFFDINEMTEAKADYIKRKK